MKRLFGVATRLYPRWWRRRYEHEFIALLEDMTPGWRELFDVIEGAVVMQMKTIGWLPVTGALAGVLVGGVVAMSTPERFASAGTVRLATGGKANAQETGQRLQSTFGKAVADAGGTPEAASVTLLGGDSDHLTLQVKYIDREPAAAKRVAERLTAAIASSNGGPDGSTSVLDAPALPTAPLPDNRAPVIVGGVLGLASGLVLLRVRSRRRPTGAA